MRNVDASADFAEKCWRWFPELRHSSWDAALVSLALVHGVVILCWPSISAIALGIWWNSNTVAHYFIHLPFFREPFWNRCFSAYQTLLLGIPQRLWRNRHLAHHADVRWRLRWSRQFIFETGLVAVLWISLIALAPAFFLKVYLPGWVLGLGLCFLQGHFEHAHGVTSHYGWLYNSLFLNDGYHVEHHAYPTVHWRALPRRKIAAARASRWPSALRWMEHLNLDTLEAIVLRSRRLQAFVLSRHRAAFQALLDAGAPHSFQSVAIVGGGLFPRTALILRQLLPHCALTIIDENASHLAIARRWLGDGVEYVEAHYDGTLTRAFDAIVIPLAFRGDRDEACIQGNARTLFVHDWIWRRQRNSRIVSWWLLKRLNRIDA